jgi:hypothetical protein
VYLRLDVAVFRPDLLDVRQLSALISDSDAYTALLPGVTTLLQDGVLEFTAAAHDKRHRPLLLRVGLSLYLYVLRTNCSSIVSYSA